MPSDVLELKEVAEPVPKGKEALIRVYATPVNAAVPSLALRADLPHIAGDPDG